MKIIADISKLLRLSPKIAFTKIIEVVKSKFSNFILRKRDRSNTTFNSKPLSLTKLLYSYFDLPDNSFISEYRSDIIDLSDKYCKHEFNLLGSGWVNNSYGMKSVGLEGYVFSPSAALKPNINEHNSKTSNDIAQLLPKEYKRIDWQLDFKSGYRWSEKLWYKDIKYGLIPGPDIKIPWELGRMQHLFILSWASVLNAEKECNNNNKFCYEIRNQILDFVASNPPKFGVQWMSTMDVSIRLCNWLFAYDILKKSEIDFDNDFMDVFTTSVYTHYQFIANNLEHRAGMKANHYFANIAGLLFASAYLPESEETLSTLNFSINEIISETFNQFYNDGSNFEQSTYYHLLVTEILFISLVVIKRIAPEKVLSLSIAKVEKLYTIDKKDLRIVLPEEFNLLLSKIMNFVKDIESEENSIFRIGDDDGGYFLGNFYRQFSLLNNINKPYNTIFLIDLYNKINTDARDQSTAGTIDSYPDFGLYIKKNKNYKLLIRCGSIGQNGKGGHSHNDQLSVCLLANGLEFIVDPGTYLYTPLHHRRNEFRSVKSHNTLYFDGQEQNLWQTNTKDDLFWIINERTRSEVIESNENQFTGMHHAYQEIHTRNIQFSDKGFAGTDHCEINKNKIIAFHFHPDVNIKQSKKKLLISRGSTKIAIDFSSNYEINDYSYSPTYGILQKAEVLHIISDQYDIKWNIEIIQ